MLAAHGPTTDGLGFSNCQRERSAAERISGGCRPERAAVPSPTIGTDLLKTQPSSPGQPDLEHQPEASA